MNKLLDKQIDKNKQISEKVKFFATLEFNK